MGAVETSITNNSIIRPLGFYITGFTSLQFANLYFIFLAIVYIITVLSNFFVLSIIWLEHRLHTPKYIAVANLAVVDIVLSTTVIPGMIKTFLVNNDFITYNACFIQMCFYYCFASLESFSIGVLAYDRLIAICFPLRHNSINTITNMICILGIVWTFCMGVALFSTSIMTRLSFCNSLKVYSYFCSYAPVFRLSCNDNSLQRATASSVSLVVLFGPLSFIIISYACILIAVFRMSNVESRYKALATCTEHLILVAIFYVPILTLFIIDLYLFLVDPDIRMLNLSLASCIPPCLNPIVYSLATKEVKNKALVVFHKVKAVAWEGEV